MDKQLLNKFKLFAELSPDKLEKISRESELVNFKANEVIFKQDDPAINLYGVVDGEVELSLNFKDMVLKADIRYEESNFSKLEYMEKPLVLEIVGPAELFGWSALMSTARETTTARCSRDSRVVSVPAAHLKAMFRSDPAMGYIVMSGISEIITRRLRSRTEKLIEAWGQAFGSSQIYR